MRLACMKPAASVRSEPGSNSPIKNLNGPESPLQSDGLTCNLLTGIFLTDEIPEGIASHKTCCSASYSIFKEPCRAPAISGGDATVPALEPPRNLTRRGEAPASLVSRLSTPNAVV